MLMWHRSALDSARGRIFFLDAYILLLVLYRGSSTATAAADVVYPPPQQSALWRTISKLRQVGV